MTTLRAFHDKTWGRRPVDFIARILGISSDAFKDSLFFLLLFTFILTIGVLLLVMSKTK